MAVIDEQDNFSNISWHSGHQNAAAAAALSSPISANPVFDHSEGPGAKHPDMDEDPTGMDPGLTGDILDCTVSEPHKENDGTSDSYVSYLVTTNVSLGWLSSSIAMISFADTC